MKIYKGILARSINICSKGKLVDCIEIYSDIEYHRESDGIIMIHWKGKKVATLDYNLLLPDESELSA